MLETIDRMATGARPGLKATRLGVAAVLGVITVFSVFNVIVKIVQMSAVTFAFYRLWLGAGVMVVLMLATGRRLTWAKIRTSAPGGLLFGFNILLFFLAIRATAVADVLIIAALQPALTMLVAGRLFGERVTRHEVAWTGVSLVGVVLVAVGQSGTPVWSLRGDLFAVGALLVWTVYFLVSKRVRRVVPAVEYMTTVTLISAVVITPVALLSGEPLSGVRMQDWLWLALFVAGAQGGHVLLAWAHAHVDVSVSSLLILAEPAISAVAALVFLGEPITALAVAGGAVVLASVAAIVRRATRTGEPVSADGAAPV
jgi:drug/metabolite transporter (DMT)-like permease